MSHGKRGAKPPANGPGRQPGADPTADPPADPGPDDLSVGEWTGRKRPVYRKFPGPRMADVALRIAMEREPFAQITAHAKESLDREVCGVLAGDVCEDDEGPFLHIKAIIRGLAARQASTHVTYTQETWNQIHETMENRYPKMQIVGWYHSHPGYGVEFSEMDVFIQKNFFSAETQVGLVTDPLGGQLGVCVNADDKIKYIGQIWVDGREQKCLTPAKTPAADSPAAAAALSDERLAAIEQRLSQTLRALDDLRTTVYRVCLTLGMIIGVAVIVWIGYSMYSSFTSSMRPPELLNYVPVPVQIGDKVVLLGVGVVKWEVPPSLIPKLQQDRKPDSNEQNPAGAATSPAGSENQNRPAEASSPVQQVSPAQQASPGVQPNPAQPGQSAAAGAANTKASPAEGNSDVSSPATRK